MEKEANDSFYRTNLSRLLEDYKIDHLFVTGCPTDFCVNATVHSALVKDFDLTIIEDCHTTADRPTMKAELNIKFHNWLWENLTPKNGKIRTINTNDKINKIEQNVSMEAANCAASIELTVVN